MRTFVPYLYIQSLRLPKSLNEIIFFSLLKVKKGNLFSFSPLCHSKMANHGTEFWKQGLLAAMNDPNAVVDSDDEVVVIKDKYPKVCGDKL